MKVLIIEDDEFAARMIAGLVRPFAKDPYIAHDMREASRIIEMFGEEISIITVDLTVPPENDREFVMQQKITEIRAKAPRSLIVVMTGMTLPGDVEKCLKAGADGYFEKMEVATPNAFMTQLKALVLELMKQPTSRNTRLRVIEAVSACIAQVAGGETSVEYSRSSDSKPAT